MKYLETEIWNYVRYLRGLILYKLEKSESLILRLFILYFYPVLSLKYVLSLCTINGPFKYAGSLWFSLIPTVHIVPNKVSCGCAMNLTNFSVASNVGST